MLKQVFEWSRGILFLTRDVADLQSQERDVREEIDQIHDSLIDLAHRIERLSERERLEREKNLLQLENAVLKLERRLPPGKSGK